MSVFASREWSEKERGTFRFLACLTDYKKKVILNRDFFVFVSFFSFFSLSSAPNSSSDLPLKPQHAICHAHAKPAPLQEQPRPPGPRPRHHRRRRAGLPSGFFHRRGDERAIRDANAVVGANFVFCSFFLRFCFAMSSSASKYLPWRGGLVLGQRERRCKFWARRPPPKTDAQETLTCSGRRCRAGSTPCLRRTAP